MKRVLWGYKANDVQEKLDEMKLEEDRLTKEIEKQEKVLSKLEEEFSEMKAKEESINSVMISAHNTAKDMLADAKKQADEIVATAQKDIEVQLKEIEKCYKDASLRQTKLLQAETKIRTNLLVTLDEYINIIDTESEDKLGDLQADVQEIEAEQVEAVKEVPKPKSTVVLPTFKADEQKEELPVFKMS